MVFLFGSRRVEPDAFSDKDIVIPVIGPTGAGKSTFINTATNGREVEVGHGLESCTGKVEAFRFPFPDDPEERTIVFVDTPAFNHDKLEGTETEKMISKWIKKTTARKIKVAGILYMHRISDNKVNESPLTHLRAFEKLCGDDFPRKTLLVTTMWSGVDPALGARREEELRTKHWKAMMLKGSNIDRFDGSHDSAWHAVKLLLNGPGS